GAVPALVSIPGIDDPRVIDCLHIHEKDVSACRNIVILGGGLTGMECAVDMALKGHDVSILEMRNCLAHGAPYITLLAVRDYIEKLDNVHTYLRHKVTRIDESGVHTLDKNGQNRTFPADAVVSCFGMQSRREETDALRAAADANVITVGDCLSPGTMYEAGTFGFWAGYSIYGGNM
ncbi:MAG: NAD(P)/FAD-dependent oxidoreductase, partial [Synergistaceae bacterium]|nr:NAD(P)/FAD-dependent oxidoreductase [Synergistaceae bacterium]